MPPSQTPYHSASYEVHFARFAKMDAETCHGHMQTLADNVKRKIVSDDFARALRDAFAIHRERAETRGECDRVAAASAQVDPRIANGTHRIEVTMEKCGGKGQWLRVESVVPVRDLDSE